MPPIAAFLVGTALVLPFLGLLLCAAAPLAECAAASPDKR